MPKFSLLNLLLIVSIAALAISLVVVRQTFRDTNEKLSSATKELSVYRHEFGKLEIGDSNQCHILHFKDRYTSDTEFRWRIYVPDASKCNIYYSYGVLPKEGLPEESKALIPNRLPRQSAELVLIVDNRQISGTGSGDLRIGFYPEFENDNSAPMQGTKIGPVDWIPWFQQQRCTFENPPFDAVTKFNLEEPFIIMKHYTTNDAGDLVGYMFWIEDPSRRR